MDRKLSRLQKQILHYLLVTPWEYRHWGVHWQPSKGASYWSRSDAARLSRALTRLEQRGLVESHNVVSGDNVGQDWGRYGPLKKRRRTHVKLTEPGKNVAKQLT
jgi:hypothetical protein